MNKDKFIVLVTGGRGCEDPDTPVMMADLTVKKIKDIKVGDQVMGDDGTPRNVLRTLSGRGMMYKIHQRNADDYIVNDIHKLVVRKLPSEQRRGRYAEYPAVSEIPVKEFVSKSGNFQRAFYGYKSGSISYKESTVEIPPYLLGLWLGDGDATNSIIINPEDEILNYITDYCEHNSLRTHIVHKNNANFIAIRGTKQGSNSFWSKLCYYNLVRNKHIPQEYISNSEKVRLELLAGLLDTDGSVSNKCYSITQKKKELAFAIKFIADTLGFKTSVKESHSYIGDKDYGIYYRVSICGDVWRIPCKVARKIVRESDCKKTQDWHVSSLQIEPLGEGDWCGFTLDGNNRYLGGDGTVKRNSGKSYSTSTFISRLTFEMGKDGSDHDIAHQILYTRYTMTSAGMSIIPEVMDKVNADGLSKYFGRSGNDLVNVMTGSHIMFRGIKTSSGNQTAKLKSIKGLSVFVCDEAEEFVSERDFETIVYSIRQQGLKNLVIIIMNPSNSNHFIYQRYIKDTHKLVEYDGFPVQISTHPNVLHIHTSYLDNLKYLAPQFIEEAKAMKEKDPDRYAHIFMGRWDDVAEGAIFKKWGIVKEFPEGCKHVGRGLDLGYSHDPSACVKCGILSYPDGDDLYLDEQFYRTGMLSTDLIRELKKDDTFVYSESADPRLIDEIALGGVIIYPVSKSPDSIKAGIDKLLTFRNIFITERSVNLQEETRQYTWAQDKNGNYINVPIDAYNHCFVGSTKVMTDKGEVRIDEIKVGDMVLTSEGYRKVTKFFDQGIKQTYLYILTTWKGNKFSVECTPDHKFKTQRGWVEVDNLNIRDVIYTKNGEELLTDIRRYEPLQEQVYDIEVDEMHEFYANGVLVHNCWDSIRYWCLCKLLGKVMKPKNTTKERLGLY